MSRPITLNGGYPMPGWFDIATLDDSGPEDKRGFEETRGRIEQVRCPWSLPWSLSSADCEGPWLALRGWHARHR